MEALLTALEDSDRDLRHAAGEALGKVGEKRATEALVRHLTDKDEWVCKAAAKALQNVSWEPVDPAQRARQCVLLEKWDEAAQAGEAAVPALTIASASRISTTRMAAVKALARISSAKIGEPLAARLSDDVPEIRKAAAQALKHIGWAPRTPEHSGRFAIEIHDWESASLGGNFVLPLLMEIVKAKAENPDSWQGAESALAGIQDPNAVPFLVELACDPDLASASLKALEATLGQYAAKVAEQDLLHIMALPGLAQNQYEFDQTNSTFQIVGFEPLSTERVLQYASRELERRKNLLTAAG
jgi:HEAT repeat protein